ncbi:MAG: hypothetical protein GY943_33125 [Chloroflexi bacterium]|nr:hypothetical protein [Chloroflexota bacterium]
MEEKETVPLDINQQIRLTLFAGLLGVFILMVAGVCGFANRVPELFEADPTAVIGQDQGEIVVVANTAVSTSTPSNTPIIHTHFTPTSTPKRPLDNSDNVTPAPTQPVPPHRATPTSLPQIDLDQFVASLTWEPAAVESDFEVQKLHSIAYGWRGAWYCNGPLQWLNDDTLMLNPIIGYTNWFENPTGGEVTQPVIVDLGGAIRWLTNIPPTDRCDLPVWSDALQAVIEAGDGAVRVRTLSGALQAEYPGGFPLHIAPSGLRLLANKHWIDLETETAVELGGASRVHHPNPGWTADEKRFYECCFSYGSVNSAIIQNQPSLPEMTVTGMGVGPGFLGSMSKWVADDTLVMLEPSGLSFWKDDYRPIVPLIDPITQSYEDVVEQLHLPDNVIDCGTHVSPTGDAFWLSCSERVGDEYHRFYEISHLISLPSWDIAAFAGKVEFRGWSPNGRFFLYNLLDDETAITGSTWLVSLDGDNVQIADYPAMAVTFSDDSNLVAFGSRDGNMLSILNTTIREQVEIPLEKPVRKLLWQPVENGLAILTDDQQLHYVADLFHPKIDLLLQIPAEYPTIHWSPNGKRLAAATENDLFIVDITAPSILPNNAVQSEGRSNSPIISHDGQLVAFTSTGRLTRHAATNLSAYVRDLENDVTELVNVRFDGVAGFDPIYNVAMSANGRFVAYYSFDENLVAGDMEICGEDDWAYNCEDLFVYDRVNKTTQRIPRGRNSGLGGDYSMALSPDGRFVTYGEDGQLIIYDVQTETAVAALQTIDSNPPNGYTYAPKYADNGDIAFVSTADNLVASDTNGFADVFVRDVETGEISRMSVTSTGAELNAGSGSVSFSEGSNPALAISGNGRIVAFASQTTTLSPDLVVECEDVRGIQPCFNIFVHDRNTGKTRLITQTVDRLPADGKSVNPSLSADGRYLVFSSTARNLLDEPMPPCEAANQCGHIFLYDLQTDVMQLISRAEANGFPADDASWAGMIAGNGRTITYASVATDLVANDSNNQADIFLYDLDTGQTERVSLRNDDV